MTLFRAPKAPATAKRTCVSSSSLSSSTSSHASLLFLILSAALLMFTSRPVCAYQAFVETTSMPYPLSDNVAVVFDSNITYPTKDGPRIYLQGGCIRDQTCSNNTDGTINCYCTTITGSCLFFKPEQGSWHTCAPSTTPRYRHSAARIGQYLFVAMGRDVSDNIITTIERYDTLADSWIVAYNWSQATSDGGMFAQGSKLYLVGGYLQNYSVSRGLTMIDTTTGIFSTMQPMATARGDIAVVPFKQYFYVLGGWENDFCNALRTVERYNPANNTWSSVADMLFSRGDLAAGSIDDFVFSIAGETKDARCLLSVPVRNVGRYDAGRNQWFLEDNIPLDLFRFVGVSYTGSSGSLIYLFGGQGPYDPVRSLYPIKDTTIRYIPTSLAAPPPPSPPAPALSSGGIAGVVVGVIVVLAVLLAAALGYIAYNRGFAYKRHINTTDLSTAPGLGSSAGSVALDSAV